MDDIEKCKDKIKAQKQLKMMLHKKIMEGKYLVDAKKFLLHIHASKYLHVFIGFSKKGNRNSSKENARTIKILACVSFST